MITYKSIKRTTLFNSIAAALVLSVSATANADGDSHSHDAPDDQEVVATVNGKSVSALALKRVTEQLAAQGQQPERAQIVEELINLEVLTQAAEELGLDKEDDVATALHLQYTQTMANAYLGAFSKDLTIGEEEIRAEYEKQIAAMKSSEYKASHILLDSEDDAKNIIAELDKGGDFTELAKQHSTGPTGANGGDLGWFQPESMVPAFSEAVAKLEKGAITADPVQTEFGWHIIQLNDSREAAKPDYSPAVKQGIQSTLLRDALSEKVESLRSAATIEIK